MENVYNNIILKNFHLLEKNKRKFFLSQKENEPIKRFVILVLIFEYFAIILNPSCFYVLRKIDMK